MNETREIGDPADESSSERKVDAKDRQVEDDDRSDKTTPSMDSHTYRSARTPSLSDCRDSGEVSPNLSNLNLGKFAP